MKVFNDRITVDPKILSGKPIIKGTRIHAIERCIRMFTPDTTLKKPFHDRTQLQPLPIDLVMGQEFDIYRPGNAGKMKELLLEDGCLWFEDPKASLDGSLKKAKTC
ncbi:MAG: DUF433 domain-containing protein [Candidatus Lokiarchaeota archaeon]|nr:DUF433 domain-containing protein [Candidatus Lokiarchaeota archaeon]